MFQSENFNTFERYSFGRISSLPNIREMNRTKSFKHQISNLNIQRLAFPKQTVCSSRKRLVKPVRSFSQKNYEDAQYVVFTDFFIFDLALSAYSNVNIKGEIEETRRKNEEIRKQNDIEKQKFYDKKA